ncbi:hypothetical protein RYB01_03015 [Pseudomonas syringae]|nr:hypothetical protein [Pseudomonas syringae]
MSFRAPSEHRLMPYQQALVGVARWPDPHFNSLLNRGTVVPLVFGFEKVRGLSAHEISTSIPGKNNRFMYKANEHRLAGEADGGNQGSGDQKPWRSCNAVSGM